MGQNHTQLPMVYSRPNLSESTDTIATQGDVSRQPHLRGIEVKSIEAKIRVLIDSDASQMLQPREVRKK